MFRAQTWTALAVAMWVVLAVPSWSLKPARAGGLLSSGGADEQDLSEGTRPLIRRLLAMQEHVTIMDVGANEGDFGGPGRKTNSPVQDAFGAPGVRAFLLEPNPPVFATLAANVKSAFGGSERITPMELAVCANVSEDVSFYAVAPKFAEDFPKAPHWMKSELSSMDRSHVVENLRIQCLTWHKAGCSGLSSEATAAYVQEVRVPCKTPRDLLKGLSLPAVDLDILKVDAEGYDAGIVRSFLELDGFSAPIIIFEGTHMDPDTLHQVFASLTERGYTTNCMEQDSKAPRCAMDVMAWRKDIFH